MNTDTLTVYELAQRWGVSRQSVHYMVQSDTLPGVIMRQGPHGNWRYEIPWASVRAYEAHRERGYHSRPPCCPDCLTLRQASSEYGIPDSTLRTAVFYEQLPAHQNGHRWCVTRADVAAYHAQWRATTREDAGAWTDA